MKYSIIVPVYNRLDEVEDLLASLSRQTFKDFETVIVEDGSTAPCKDAVDRYADKIDIKYYMKPNEGRSIAAKLRLERARATISYFSTLTA